MYSLAIVAGLAAVVAGSPAPQAIDLGAVLSASSPTATGPALTATAETNVYNPTSATATITATATTAALNKVKRDDTGSVSSSTATFCWGAYPNNFCIGGQYDTSATPDFFPTTTIYSTKIAATTTTSTSTACATAIEAGTYCGFINPEDQCAPQPNGNGPHVEPDTVDAFLAYQPFHQVAQSAKTPSGYANVFKDVNASASGNGYLGLHTLSSYDVTGCSQWCDNTTLCTAFNIYIERDPSLNPDGAQCTTPPSITNYKCTLWGSSLSSADATNQGGWRDSFQVVIAGSNGYDKSNTTTPATCPGWQAPQSCGGKAHNHGSTCLGQKFFPGPFDPSVCAAFAAAQNKAQTVVSWWQRILSWFYTPVTCNFFNSYSLKKDDRHMGTYCLLYTKQYAPSAATYQPGWLSGHYFGVGASWSYCSK